MATALGVAPSTVVKWEQDQISLAVSDLLRLSQVYGVNPKSIFSPPGGDERLSDDEKLLAAQAMIDDDINPLALGG